MSARRPAGQPTSQPVGAHACGAATACRPDLTAPLSSFSTGPRRRACSGSVHACLPLLPLQLLLVKCPRRPLCFFCLPPPTPAPNDPLPSAALSLAPLPRLSCTLPLCVCRVHPACLLWPATPASLRCPCAPACSACVLHTRADALCHAQPCLCALVPAQLLTGVYVLSPVDSLLSPLPLLFVVYSVQCRSPHIHHDALIFL